MSLIIGLVGEKGSGKGTFVSFLKAAALPNTLARIGSSDILAETLNIWKIERNRRNLQDVSIVMTKHFGKDALSNAVRARLASAKADIIIFDGVRWPSDVAMIKKFPHNLLVYVTAKTKARYDRTKIRKEKIGENISSYQKFLEEEKVATEFKIPSIGKKADIQIINDDSIETYKKLVEKIYETKIKKLVK